MNRATVLTLLGGLALALTAALAILGHPAAAMAALCLALLCVLALLLVTLRRVQSMDKGTQQRMQRDRRLIVSEVRRAAATVEAVASTPKPTPPSKTPKPKVFGNSLGTAAALCGIGPTFEFAERAREARGSLETFALRVKSLAIRDVFARSATNLQFDTAELIRVLRVLRAGKLPGVSPVANWEPRQLLALARILANQRLRPQDLEDAEVIFNAVRKVFGTGPWGRSDGYLHAEVLSALGRHREAAGVLKGAKVARRDPVHTALLTANAHAAAVVPDWDAWAELVNTILEREELAPVRVRPDNGLPALDRLSCDLEPRTVDGPLISVIVPTFNGTDFIRTTLDCLVQQTWKQLEVIVVDDASDPAHQAALQQICATYADVRLIQQPTNLGAYPARNRALTDAQGELITVHDDDDWSHPQKLEIQATHLLANPDVAANMTRHARASDGLVFTRINNNPSFSQGNYSSLMFRRELVELIGPWDEVNRGADAEFRDRILASTDQTVELLLEAPLSFTRVHSASLTANEIGRGYLDPSRILYQSAYQRAHACIREKGISTGLAFPRPLNMAPGMRGKHLGTFDVVFATDFRFPGGTTHLTLNEVAAAVQMGLRVGIIHMLSPLNGSAALNERALDVASTPGVEILSLSDTADVSLLLIRHPSVLQFADGLRSKLNVRDCIVIVNNPPVLSGGKGFSFDLETVRGIASTLFGSEPEVLAESGVTLQQCLPLFPAGQVSLRTWPGFIDTTAIHPRTERDFSLPPTLGRHSRDAALKWPSLAVMENVYRNNPVYRARIMGGADSLDQSRRDFLTQHSDLLPFGAIPVPQFLHEIDFWAYFHSDELTESFGMATIEAMAAGLVVILPPYMEQNFGDGALYATPDGVSGLVQKYWSDPALYAEQSQRARARVEEWFSRDAFETRLRDAVAETLA